MTSRWQQQIANYLYVVTESVAWFMPIALITTWSERDFLTQVSSRLALEAHLSAPELLVSERIQAASSSLISGPSVVIVALAGVIAFALMRAFTTGRIEGAFGALSLLVISVLVLNALLHVALAGDLKFWDTKGLASFLGNPASHFPDHIDLAAFVAHPSIGRPHGAAATAAFMGLLIVWVRFLIAGRHPVTFERAARSFTIGFSVTLAVVAVASIGGVGPIAGYAVPYFVLAVLTLAVAHSARPQVAMEGARRTAPWVISVSVTVAVLAIAALLFGLLALLNAGAAFVWLTDGIFRVFGVILVIVITPVFWLFERIVELLRLGAHVNQQLPTATSTPPPLPSESASGSNAIGSVLLFTAKLLAVTLLTYGSFVALRALLNRRRHEPDEEFVETRVANAGGTGLGSLLRNLVPRRRAGPDRAWMRRHAIYGLFGRAVADAQDRGLAMRPGETPLEFADTGRRLLAADPMPGIADAFDRARYGRHYPDDAELTPLERALAEWERAHPASDEQRERIRGARELSEARRVEANIILAKRASRGDPNARRLL